MLTIRLARGGRKKRAFFRVVLTEHTKPAQSWFKEILWWFDPFLHSSEIQVDKVKERISKWAKPSPRVAKILFNNTKDTMFEKYFVTKNLERKTKNPDKFTD